MVKKYIAFMLCLVFVFMLVGCSKETKSAELKMTVAQYRPSTTELQATEEAQEQSIEEQTNQATEPSPNMYEAEVTSSAGLGGMDFSNLPTVQTTTKEEQTTQESTTEYVPPTTIAAVVETTQYIETTVAPTEESTVAVETKPTITETEPVAVSEQGVSMDQGSGEMSKGAEITYLTRGAVAFKKKIAIPDVVGYDKDAYGNYIIPAKTLANSQLQLPKFASFNNRIPYCLWYDANGDVLNPLPEEYMKHKDLFYTGE